MDRFEPLGPDAEVAGFAILGFLNAASVADPEPHLAAAGLGEVDPQGWYPKQAYIDVWKSLIEAGLMTDDFVSIGLSLSATGWPPEFDDLSLEEVLSRWSDAYDTANRGADRGYIRVEKVNAKHFKVIHRTPEPDGVNYGVCYGMCQRFLPDTADFTVYYDADVPRMDYGGDETIIHLEWL